MDTTVESTLRLLTPKPPRMPGRSHRFAAMFWAGVIALLLQFFLSYVVLDAMGVPLGKVKLHPSTVLVIFGGMWTLAWGKPFLQRCRETPGLMVFIIMIPVLALYRTYFSGYSGAAVYLESYWAAGLLLVMLDTANAPQKRFLARLIIAICVLNVFIALYESVTLTTWFPLILDPDAVDKATNIAADYRPNAFFSHPLNASLVTTMAIFLLYGMHTRTVYAAPIFCILLVGLLAYGGRTALGVTLAITLLMAVYTFIRGIIRRNLKLDFMLVMLLGAVTIPLLVAIIVTQTSIANRLMDSLYFDSSAEARVTQWEIFRHLTLRNWLFGIPKIDLSVLKYQIGLGGKETDIENFWLLMFLDLGVIGFTVFLSVFGMFLYHLGRMSRDFNGWLLVIAALIIDSGANSLGVKSNDLFFEVGFIVAMSGYAEFIRQPRRVRPRLPGGLRLSETALGAVSAAKGRGLRGVTQGGVSD
jgi:hypothetical protein